MARAPYVLSLPPVRQSSVIFASPHSGRDYPWSFLRNSQLDAHAIRSSEDAFVDDLFAAAPSLGAPLLCATVPRAYLDLNRAAEELDSALIDGYRATAHNPRIASGLGVIPRVVANGRAIYAGKLTLAEADRRIARYWRPYHAALADLLAQSHALCGEAILIDCHSMPHEALDGMARSGPRRPDVVLGDRFGASAAPEITDRVEAALLRAGLKVVRNAPFAGAYMAQTYGRPSRRQHVVQIEIDRALYMDEAAITPHVGFDPLRRRLTDVIADIVAIGAAPGALAAE